MSQPGRQQAADNEPTAAERFSEFYYGTPVVTRNAMVLLFFSGLFSLFRVIPVPVFCPFLFSMVPFWTTIHFFFGFLIVGDLLGLVIGLYIVYKFGGAFETDVGSLMTVYWVFLFNFTLNIAMIALALFLEYVLPVIVGGNRGYGMTVCRGGPMPVAFILLAIQCLRTVTTQPTRSFCGANIPTRYYAIFLATVFEVIPPGPIYSRWIIHVMAIAIGYGFHEGYFDKVSLARDRVNRWETTPSLSAVTSARNFRSIDAASSGYTMVSRPSGGGGQEDRGSGGGGPRIHGPSVGGGASGSSGAPGQGGASSGKAASGTVIFGGAGHKLGSAPPESASSSMQMQTTPMHVVTMPSRPNDSSRGGDNNV